MAKHSIRLPGFDYRGRGPYFVTLVVRNRRRILAQRLGNRLALTPAGRIVEDEWGLLAVRRPETQPDAFVVMPDHIHFIIGLSDAPRAPTQQTAGRLTRPPRSLGAVVAQFKAGTTRRINALRNTPGIQLWQRNYFEHIIRSDASLQRIRRYIRDNPRKW